MKKLILLLLCYSTYSGIAQQVSFNSVAPAPTLAATGASSLYVPVTPGLLSQPNVSTLLIKRLGAWPAAALPALERVRFIWENTITSSSYTEVNMTWDNTLGAGTVATSRPTELIANYSSGYEPFPEVWYPAGVANSRNRRNDLSPGVSDIDINFNANVTWHFGLNGNAPAGTYDFITVALKKLLQGFALTSSVRNVSSNAVCSYGTTPDIYFTAYDALIRNSSNVAMSSFAVTPSPAFTTWVTNNLFWSDDSPWDNAYIANGNTALKMHTPAVFNSGVTINNLDEATYTTGASALLSPEIKFQEAIHTLNGVAKGMVEDVQTYGLGIPLCMGDAVRVSGTQGFTQPVTQLVTGGNYQYELDFDDQLGNCGFGPNTLIAYSWQLEVFGNNGIVYPVITGNGLLFSITNLTLPALPAGVDYLHNYDNTIRGFIRLVVTEDNGIQLFDRIQVSIQFLCGGPNIIITGTYSTPVTQSTTWIQSAGQTTILSTASVKLDADPVNGYVLMAPASNTDFFLSAPAANGVFVAQALDGCGTAIPMRTGPTGPEAVNETRTAGNNRHTVLPVARGFTIFPNPAGSHITVQHPARVRQLQIFDISGKLVVSALVKGGNQTQINLGSLQAGIYSLHADGKYISKIVKQ